MSITISGQYLFRGKARDDSEPVGIIYPDTTLEHDMLGSMPAPGTP
jgi:hypothetical protein